jgi:hypothetical protein
MRYVQDKQIIIAQPIAPALPETNGKVVCSVVFAAHQQVITSFGG